MENILIKDNLKKVIGILQDTIDKTTVINNCMKYLNYSFIKRLEAHFQLLKLKKQKRKLTALLQKFS
jgi:hypothetical protein